MLHYLTLASLIATCDEEHARKLIEAAGELRSTSLLSDDILVEVYINVLMLAIRSVPGLEKGDQEPESVFRELCKAIDQVPSLLMQCRLYADLAMRYLLSNKADKFQRVTRAHVLPLLDTIEPSSKKTQLLIEVGPCIFNFERTLLYEELEKLSVGQRDAALQVVLRHILFGRPVRDPVDLAKVPPIDDYQQALRYLEVLERINTDSVFYEHLRMLVTAIVGEHKPKGKRNVQHTLSEKHALAIAEKLKKLIDEKLPDVVNIRHDGYKIAALACLAHLRDSWPEQVQRVIRAQPRWENIAPTWRELAEAARNDVTNDAARALVVTWVGQQMYYSEMQMAKQLLEDAYDVIHLIPNVIDRSARLHELSSVWSELDDNNTAGLFLREAMKLLEAWTWDGARDQVTGSILELAYRVNPELAGSLTSSIDDPLQRKKFENQLRVQELKKGSLPSNMPEPSSQAEIYEGVANQWLRSLCSNRGIAQSELSMLRLTQAILGNGFAEFYSIAAWSIENQLRRTGKLSVSSIKDMYDSLMQSLGLTQRLGGMLSGLGESIYSHDRQFVVPAGLQLYSVGTREEAKAAVRKWIQENASEYLKIYDPYFSCQQLEMLKYVPGDVQVAILTTWKAQSGIEVGDTNALQKQLREMWWENVADQEPPATRMYLFGTASRGDSPMHERYIITSGGKGIKLGTSESGLGKKDSEIREMPQDEVALIERTFVERMIFSPPIQYNGEKMINRTFDLE